MRLPVLIYPTLWWSSDRRQFGCPIEVNIHTARHHVLWRPFSGSQAYDWERGCWTGIIDPARLRTDGFDQDNFDLNLIRVKRWVVSPQQPEVWETLHRAWPHWPRRRLP